jgi:hypothetical protein
MTSSFGFAHPKTRYFSLISSFYRALAILRIPVKIHLLDPLMVQSPPCGVVAANSARAIQGQIVLRTPGILPVSQGMFTA